MIFFRMENISPQSSSRHEAEISRVEEAKPFLSSEDLQKPQVNQQLEMDSEMQPTEESQARHLAQMLRRESSEGIEVRPNDLELQTLALSMEEKRQSCQDPDSIETASNQASPIDGKQESCNNPGAKECASNLTSHDAIVEPKSCMDCFGFLGVLVPNLPNFLDEVDSDSRTWLDNLKFIAIDILAFLGLNLFMPSFDLITDVKFIGQLWDILPTYGMIALGILTIPSIVALFLALTNLRRVGNKKRIFMTLKSKLIDSNDNKNKLFYIYLNLLQC